MTALASFDPGTLERVGFGLVAEVSLKGAILLLGAAVIVCSWKGASAAQRHLVWAVAFAALLALPALSLGGPRWHFPAEPLSGVAAIQTGPVEYSVESVIVRESDPPTKVEAGRRFSPALSWTPSVLVVWLGGALVLLGLLLSAIVRAMLMTYGTRPLCSGPCAEAVDTLCRRLGMPHSPRLIEAAGQIMPLTWGVLRPVILLPRGAARWPQAKLEAVLVHELAHVRRRDVLIRLMAQVGCALHWFNPLVWLALRQLRLESEQACDDVVLEAGVQATAYADQLLAFARMIRGRRGLALASTPMAEPSQLPLRIRALLEEDRDRRGVSTSVLTISLVTAATLCAVVAAAMPVSGTELKQVPTLASSTQTALTTSAARASSNATSAPSWQGPAVRREPNPAAEPGRQSAPADTTRPILLNHAAVNKQIEQNYPLQLKEAGVSGTALLQLQIDPRGRVVEAQVLSATDPAFGEAATRSLIAARFAPARAEGEPITAWIQWPVAFNAISVRPAEAAQALRAEAQARRMETMPREPAARVRASRQRAAHTAPRISQEALSAAVTRHHPTVFDHGLPETQYIWFVVTPEGEVRQSGIAEMLHPGNLGSAEVMSLLASRFSEPQISFIHLSKVHLEGPGSQPISVAWVVLRSPESI